MAGAKNNGQCVVLFGDEATLQRKTPGLIRCWTLKGKQPQIPFELGSHERLHLFGAVDPLRGLVYTRKSQAINSNGFVKFLNQIAKKHPNKMIILVVDNAGWHHSKKVKAKKPHNIRLLFLTPYSPDLNPIERLWKRLRKDVTHNSFFETNAHLQNALRRFFNYLKKHPKEIISLCGLS